MSNQKKSFVKNAADKNQVKKGRRKEEILRDGEIDDLRHILSSVQGRRFIWGLLGKCHVFKTSFTGNSTTFFNEGKRDIGLRVLAYVNEAGPELYITMMQESKKEGENL